MENKAHALAAGLFLLLLGAALAAAGDSPCALAASDRLADWAARVRNRKSSRPFIFKLHLKVFWRRTSLLKTWIPRQCGHVHKWPAIRPSTL